MTCTSCGAHVEVRGQLVGISSLSFHHVDPEDQTQVIKLGGKCLSLLGHLSSHRILYYFWYLIAYLHVYFETCCPLCSPG